MNNADELALGIDLGGTKILAGVITPDGAVIGRAKSKTRPEQGPEAVLERIAETAHEALQDAGSSAVSVSCIGIGAPGPIDPVHGIVLEAPNMGWHNVPLAAWLSDRFGLPTLLANDVNAGTWGEYRMGAGRGAGSVLGVFVGTGIGGALVLEGKLFEGASHVAGEIGHMCLDPKGPLCGCGRRGCLEAFASRTAISRDIWQAIKNGGKSKILLRETRGGPIRSRQLLKGIVSQEKIMLEALGRAARHLGIGLASAANLINPNRIVLGGGVVAALGGYYVQRVRQSFAERAFQSVLAGTELVEAELGDDAGMIGAALLAHEVHAGQSSPSVAMAGA